MRIDVERIGPDIGSVTDQVARDLQQAQRGIGRQVAKVGQKAILDDVRSRRGSLRFASGKLGVKSKVEATANGVTVTLNGTSAGSWTILESGASAHAIKPRKGKALKFGGHYAAHVMHPGTSGSREWTKAGEALEQAVTPEVEDGVATAMEG